MRGFEKLQAAKLLEWNVAAGKLYFELGAVVRRAKQHGLRLSAVCLPLAPSKPLRKRDGLGRLHPLFVVKNGFCFDWRLCSQVFREPLFGETDDHGY